MNGRLRETTRGSAETAARLGDTLLFMRSLWALNHALERSSIRMRTTIGATGLQRLALRIIGQMPGATATQIASTLLVDPSTLSGVLQRLDVRALVQRETDARDRRRARLRLTVKGRRLDRHHIGTIEAAVERALATFSDEDRRTAQALLGAIVRELNLLRDAALAPGGGRTHVRGGRLQNRPTAPRRSAR